MKTIIRYILFIYFLSVGVLFSQPEVEWKTILPTIVGNDFRLTNDNGFIVVGTTYLNTDSSKATVIKLNPNGLKRWEKRFGKNGFMYYGNSVEQTKDDGFIISAGASPISTGEEYTALIKLDVNGKFLWEKIFTGVNGVGIKQAPDGGYVFVGVNFAMKTNANGVVLWKTTHVTGYTFEKTNDNGYLIASTFYWKIDDNGNILWQKSFPGFYANGKMCKTDDNGFGMIGEKFRDDGNAEGGFILKTDANGNILWNVPTTDGIGNGIKQSIDGGFFATGYPWILLKTDSLGNRTWSINSQRHWGIAVQPSSDNGFVVLGLVDYATINGTDVIKYKPFYDPFIRVTYPMNGVVLNTGSNPIIKWNSCKTSGFVNIDLSTNGGATWKQFRNHAVDDGKIRDWIVPNSPSTQCKIRITDADGAPTAVSSGYFTILAPSIQITSPKGGEVWKAGSNPILKWNSTALSGFVNIDLSTNGGASWQQFRNHAVDDGKIRDWIVPNNPSTQCKIRITDISGSPSAISNGYFAILKSLGKLNLSNNLNELPKEFTLDQNFPNPFNPETIISYQIPASQEVTLTTVMLKIYDVIGREVSTLVNEAQSPGYYSVSFNGSALPSGVYIYRFTAGDFTSIKKMILAK